MKNKVENYDGHEDVWTTLRVDGLKLDYKTYPFDSKIDIEIGSMCLNEHKRLNR